ncbi:class I SAM-dependent methyltransferase [Actinomycetospora straminea]|uniref:SAM-dependent methyltransferase n=1 Tax=Actinomycetospora straminea TaxID=663607 RepID=A0ABP9EFI9_9PSEU|nr:class I SAM-dependent methyltransferase [Actinomycetospora straminea]MDD7934393.1 class I SAM-dependent methyltransferase [Actinomycetospora straminea]
MSLSSEYFDELYAADADPWGIERGWYEERKRAVVLAALPRPRYARAFEPGCAGGSLSVPLAARCDELVCWDPAQRAVDATRARLADRPHVRVEQGALPPRTPDGTFDLVVASEVVYYLDDADRAAFWDAVTERLRPGGHLLAVHWLREAPEYPVEGGAVHDELADRPGLARVVRHDEADFRLEVYARTPPEPRSVAQETGLR